jgi:hypothetical protein
MSLSFCCRLGLAWKGNSFFAGVLVVLFFHTETGWVFYHLDGDSDCASLLSSLSRRFIASEGAHTGLFFLERPCSQDQGRLWLSSSSVFYLFLDGVKRPLWNLGALGIRTWEIKVI